MSKTAQGKRAAVREALMFPDRDRGGVVDHREVRARFYQTVRRH